MEQVVQLSNPIPQALRRYRGELLDTLDRAGMTAEDAPWARSVEGEPGARGKLVMLRRACLNIRDARRSSASVVQLWPSLGLLEARLWAPREARGYVVLHDPEPLDRQVGHAGWQRRWAAAAHERTRPVVLVHSQAAFDATRELLPHHDLRLVLHPILSGHRRSAKSSDPSVVVAGQYKATRNLSLLRRLGPMLRSRGWTPRIIGRGWPTIPGWDVESRFVSEAELDAALANAWALLLPYDRYYQSGIAIRALENGTPTVGLRTDFLDSIFGDSPMVLPHDADESAYVEALERAHSLTPADIEAAHASYAAAASTSWGRLEV